MESSATVFFCSSRDRFCNLLGQAGGSEDMFFLRLVDNLAKTGCIGLGQGLWNRKLKKKTNCTLKAAGRNGMELRYIGKGANRTVKEMDCMVDYRMVDWAEQQADYIGHTGPLDKA